MRKRIQKTELTNGYTISQILKGGWQLSAGHGGKIDPEQAIVDMFAFVDAGITTFDFGDIYTGVEEVVGEFRKRYIKRFGRDRATDIQLHTKFVPDLASLKTFSYKDAEAGIDKSLRKLGVEYLDLVQFHWWDYEIPRYVEVAEYLVQLQKRGKIARIGITNFDRIRLQELLTASIPIATAQVQYSLLDHRPEHGFVELCKEHNIKLLCYGIVAGGFLSEKYLGVPEPKEPLENRSLVKYKLIIDEFGGWELFQLLLVVLKKIANKHDVSITNAASRYILEKEQVAGIIIGARNTLHVGDSVRTFSFDLASADMREIDKIVRQARGPKGDIYALERIKGGAHSSIMKYNLNKEGVR